eukprot:1185654-Prorocentrum_minimum.AAC.1
MPAEEFEKNVSSLTRCIRPFCGGFRRRASRRPWQTCRRRSLRRTCPRWCRLSCRRTSPCTTRATATGTPSGVSSTPSSCARRWWTSSSKSLRVSHKKYTLPCKGRVGCETSPPHGGSTLRPRCRTQPKARCSGDKGDSLVPRRPSVAPVRFVQSAPPRKHHELDAVSRILMQAAEYATVATALRTMQRVGK